MPSPTPALAARPALSLWKARWRALQERARGFAQRHHFVLELALFLGGFFLDVAFTNRIDSQLLLLHQGLSLAACVALVAWDHRLAVRGTTYLGWRAFAARKRQWAMHLVLGGLLNAFLVFFFRSSGPGLALLFVALLLALVVLNEAPAFRGRGPLVRVALLSFAMSAFLMYLLPILSGALRPGQSLLAIALGALFTLLLWRAFLWLTPDPQWTFRRAALPGLLVQATLAALLLADAVPPVPLSLKHIGIYSGVRPAPDGSPMHVFLTWQAPEVWLPWRDDSDTFVDVAGQKVWVYARVFAPMAFDDTVLFQWEQRPQGGDWEPLGNPQPEPVHGGMEEGFRVWAARALGHSGDYRVRVLTEDGRELGRRTFRFEVGVAPKSLSGID